jgi:putative addiction module killer protein
MIEIRETEDYKKWFAELRDRKARSIIDIRLKRVEKGNFGEVRPAGEGVSELIFDYGPGYRIYYEQVGKVLVILFGGGTKKTQEQDIQKAHELARLV